MTKNVTIDVSIIINEDSGNKVFISIGGSDLKSAQKWIELMEKLILAEGNVDGEAFIDISQFGVR